MFGPKTLCPNCQYPMRKVGYKWSCDGCTFQSEQPTPTEVMVADVKYDSKSDYSYDHLTPVLQMQGIHFAMMRYFGSGDSGSMLNDQWLAAREKEFPGRFKTL